MEQLLESGAAAEAPVELLEPFVEPAPLRLVPAPAPQAEHRELALYVVAGAVYVTIGVFVTEVLRSWIIGFAFLLLWVWVLPALARRLRR